MFNRGGKVKDNRSYLALFQRRVNARESNYNAHLKQHFVKLRVNSEKLKDKPLTN